MTLILASASPRRRALLAQIGVAVEVRPVHIDEAPGPDEPAADYVTRLALEKARAGFAACGRGPVLGSDTTVVCDGLILAKPASQAEGVAMLQRLSGRTHQVMTAVALVDGDREAVERVTTEVTFRAIGADEARRYWATGEPRDKAGGYAIQGLGAVFVRRIEGSYSAVVGLPLAETAELLTRFGVPVWQQVRE